MVAFHTPAPASLRGRITKDGEVVEVRVPDLRRATSAATSRGRATGGRRRSLGTSRSRCSLGLNRLERNFESHDRVRRGVAHLAQARPHESLGALALRVGHLSKRQAVAGEPGRRDEVPPRPLVGHQRIAGLLPLLGRQARQKSTGGGGDAGRRPLPGEADGTPGAGDQQTGHGVDDDTTRQEAHGRAPSERGSETVADGSTSQEKVTRRLLKPGTPLSPGRKTLAMPAADPAPDQPKARSGGAPDMGRHAVAQPLAVLRKPEIRCGFSR